MGLFSRDETISVASVIYPMGPEPDKIPDIVASSIIAAGMLDKNQADAVDSAIFDGAGVKLSQAYRYAANHYYNGLPTGFPAIRVDKDDPLLEMLCAEYLATVYPTAAIDVKTVAVEYTDNFETVLHQQIETKYNYDFVTEEVHTTVFGLPVGSTLEITVLPSDEDLHPNDLGWRLTFTKPDATEVVFDEWFAETVFASHETVENRIIMEVSLDAAPSITLSYAKGGSDPRLNLFLSMLETPQSGTFPGIILKKNKGRYLNQDSFTETPWQTSAAYTTSKRYAERLGINIDEVLATVKANPDQKKIDWAFIQPGTKINSPNTPVHEYHFNYFNRLRLSFADNKPAYDAWVAAYTTSGVFYSKNKAKGCPAQSVHITDPDYTKHTVNMEIAWRYMTYEVKTGTLPKPYTVECGPHEIITSAFKKGIVPKLVKYDVTKLYLRKRLTDTTYAELMVCGLMHENYVYKGESVKSAVWDAFNDPEGDFGTGFLIPLEYDVFMSLSSGRQRLQFAQEALHIIFNCYKVTKQQWYETGIFKIFLVIVSIAIVAVTWGAASGAVAALNMTLENALIAAGISATMASALAVVLTAAVTIGTTMAVSYAAKEAGEWAAEQWGPAWGALVQIGVAVGMTYGIGSFINGITGFTTPPIGLVESAVSATSYLLAGLATYTEYEFAQLQEKQSAWNDYINSPDNPLEKVNKLIEQYFPEMGIIEETALFGPRERMDEFLGRTLTLVDGLTYRLTLPITHLTEMTLTPRLS